MGGVPEPHKDRAFGSLSYACSLVLRVSFAYTRRNDLAQFPQHALCRKEILSPLFSNAAHNHFES